MTASLAKEGSTNPDWLQEKHPAAVHYVLEVLKRYDALPVETIREIALEVGLIGQSGLDYSSPDQKYTLKSLAGENFTGLHLMCLMYAGFESQSSREPVGGMAGFDRPLTQSSSERVNCCGPFHYRARDSLPFEALNEP